MKCHKCARSWRKRLAERKRLALAPLPTANLDRVRRRLESAASTPEKEA